MTTLSVPLSGEFIEYITAKVKSGDAANKADVVRKALMQMRENDAINAVLESQKEMREGKIFWGDLDEIAKKFND